MKLYGITRKDIKATRTYAWVVTLTRARRVYRKYFSDGVYGGKRASLAAAKRYRDEVIAKHASLSRRDYANVRRRNNRSGVPGVCKSPKPRRRFGKHYREWFWIAYWTPAPGGACRHKSFSMKKYGAKEAFRRAVEARRRGLAQMQAGPHVNHPAQARAPQSRT